MSQYRCAIVGVSGGRAHGHAEAFVHMPRGELVAVSTRNRSNLDRFGEKWNVQARFTDFDVMFREIQPDLVFVNTPPHVRLEVLQSAAAHGVGGVIVEKPLALQAEDFTALLAFARSSPLKVAINHQLHFHPRRMELQRLVREGGIGAIQRIRASARMNMAYQGTHVLQAIQAFQSSPPQRVTTTLMEGGRGLQVSPRMHLAPDRCTAEIEFEDASTALLQVGDHAPRINPDDDRISHHKQIAVEGAAGMVAWTMTSWKIQSARRSEEDTHDYHEEDIVGQARMSEAMFNWLENDEAVHPLHLDAALRDFRLMLAMYISGLVGEPQTLDDPLQDHLLDTMRERLA